MSPFVSRELAFGVVRLQLFIFTRLTAYVIPQDSL